MVTVAYINRYGGRGSPLLCMIATRLWQWAHPVLLTESSLCARTIERDSGHYNMLRGSPIQQEWRLHPEVVHQIWSRFRGAEVFSPRESTHCHLFFSLQTTWCTPHHRLFSVPSLHTPPPVIPSPGPDRGVDPGDPSLATHASFQLSCQS